MAKTVQSTGDDKSEIDSLMDEIDAKAEGSSADGTKPLPEPESKPEPEPEAEAGRDKDAPRDARRELDSLPTLDEEPVSPAPSSTPEETAEEPTLVDATQVEEKPVGPLPASTPITDGYHKYTGDATPTEGDTPQKKAPRRRRARIAVGAIAAGLAVVYVGGSIYFSSHFLPNTTVNGENVSGMSTSELASQITSTGEDYSTTVSGDNLSIVVKGSDIDLSYDGDTYASDAISQSNAWAWPVEVFGSRTYTVDDGISYDTQKLTDIVSASVDELNANASQPTNASISYNSDSGQFEIVPEQYGTAVDEDSVLQAVEEGVASLSTSITLGEDQLVQPTVRSDDATLAASVEKANELVQLTIPLDIDGTEVTQVTPEMIAGWITVDDEGNVSVDTDAIKTWTQGDLSKQYDSVGTSRTYTRADGKEVTVSGGTYGWSLDGEALANTISQQILDANATAIDVPMKSTAAVWNPGGAEWTSYIDVDLTEQHARYYDDSGNILWESDFVSGNPTEGNATPTGVYSINSNMQTGNVELRGLDENGDGEPDYISYVTYWMPFIDNLVAFHDASWRGSFGGSIYTYDGSHGCINLPSSAAQELYGMVSVGTVVVVHE